MVCASAHVPTDFLQSNAVFDLPFWSIHWQNFKQISSWHPHFPKMWSVKWVFAFEESEYNKLNPMCSHIQQTESVTTLWAPTFLVSVAIYIFKICWIQHLFFSPNTRIHIKQHQLKHLGTQQPLQPLYRLNDCHCLSGQIDYSTFTMRTVETYLINLNKQSTLVKRADKDSLTTPYVQTCGQVCATDWQLQKTVLFTKTHTKLQAAGHESYSVSSHWMTQFTLKSWGC